MGINGDLDPNAADVQAIYITQASAAPPSTDVWTWQDRGRPLTLNIERSRLRRWLEDVKTSNAGCWSTSR